MAVVCVGSWASAVENGIVCCRLAFGVSEIWEDWMGG